MNIWLWAVAYLTWCIFVGVIISLRDTKKRLVKAENALTEAESYITELHEALNEWSEAYAQQSHLLQCQFDLFDEWTELDNSRQKYDSFKEIDDFLVQSTTKEFITLKGWKLASEEKAKQGVVDLKTQKDAKKSLELINLNFKLIKNRFSEKGHEDIESLIEMEKRKFMESNIK
tara:strand:+ start:2083 stop:2604 length:522 start_codon:yes stop_codon:yes gene_type:complete